SRAARPPARRARPPPARPRPRHARYRAHAMTEARGPDATREAALRLIERMRRTRADLAKRLRDKGHDAADIERVLDRLAAVGLVDDIDYARAFLASRWGRRAA